MKNVLKKFLNLFKRKPKAKPIEEPIVPFNRALRRAVKKKYGITLELYGKASERKIWEDNVRR